MKIKAWHFLRQDGKLQFPPHTKVKAGQILKVEDEPVLCQTGLHASIRAFDALSYAPGPIVCRVEVSGNIVQGTDKLAGTERKVIWMADATETLRAFSRWCALDVIHLWKAPDVVIQYLKTGDESLRDAAWAAAWDAAWDAARDAAWDAAWAAARDENLNRYNKKLTSMLNKLKP